MGRGDQQTKFDVDFDNDAIGFGGVDPNANPTVILGFEGGTKHGTCKH